MLTKNLYDEIAEEPVDYHRLIAKMLLKEYYDYTSEYLFGDCHCTPEEAKRILNGEASHNDDLFTVDNKFAKELVLSNIEDVAKAVCGRKPGKSLEKMIVDWDWQPLHQITISYLLPEEIERFVNFTNQLVNHSTDK